MLGATTAGAPGGARPRAKAAEDRDVRIARAWDEIRSLIAPFHAQLPRDQAETVGAAYARYSSRYQDSITDQIRTIFADAIRKKVFIPLEYVFFDLAVRGCKADREGLNSLRNCLDRRAATVVFFFATNRLFRKTYRSLQFVEEQVVEKGVRAVFVKSGVDTADSKRWRSLLNMHATMDEFVVGMTADHVRAAHEGLLEKRLVFGTLSLGYAGTPLDCQVTRRGRPRMALAVDPIAGPWVERVFAWFVVERLTMSEIVRRLNSNPEAPPPPKSPDRTWTHASIRRLLSNPRYRGCWRYGVTESIWVSSKDYARQVARKEPLKEVQIEALRLVSDKQWFDAQTLLVKEAAKVVGRKPRDGNATIRPRVLNGLFYCLAHNRALYVGGVHGRYMLCKDCRGLPAEQRPLFSQLPRGLALRKTCEALARLVATDSNLVERVIAACQTEASRLQIPNPGILKTLTTRRDQFDRRIAFVLRNPGDTDTDQAVSEVELKRLRKERAATQSELDAAAASTRLPVVVPTEEEVRQLIASMGKILEAADTGESGETGLIRELIDRLTGGRIELEQVGERRAQRGWLRGRFQSQLIGTVTAKIEGRSVTEQETEVTVIDYCEDVAAPDPETVDQVKRLYGENVLIKEIARQVGLNRNAVAKILKDWFVEQGIELQDGRSRRSQLPLKHIAAPLYHQIADQVKDLADAGRLFGDIASDLEVDRNTVTAAWHYWYESRNLSAPDGRRRRRDLRKQSSPSESNSPLS